jgi:hypothetical protein
MLTSSRKVTRLQRLAGLTSDAARQALAPIEAEQRRLKGDVSRVRQALATPQRCPEVTALVGQEMADQRYRTWCETRLTDLHMTLARLEVQAAPLRANLAKAEARKLALGQIDKALKAKAAQRSRRAAEWASG